MVLSRCWPRLFLWNWPHLYWSVRTALSHVFLHGFLSIQLSFYLYASSPIFLIESRFNLYGLSLEVDDFSNSCEIILDYVSDESECGLWHNDSSPVVTILSCNKSFGLNTFCCKVNFQFSTHCLQIISDEWHREGWNSTQCMDLYGRIHSRFILTARGQHLMVRAGACGAWPSIYYRFCCRCFCHHPTFAVHCFCYFLQRQKYLKGEFGYCPRVFCRNNGQRQPLLPVCKRAIWYLYRTQQFEVSSRCLCDLRSMASQMLYMSIASRRFAPCVSKFSNQSANWQAEVRFKI